MMEIPGSRKTYCGPTWHWFDRGKERENVRKRMKWKGSLHFPPSRALPPPSLPRAPQSLARPSSRLPKAPSLPLSRALTPSLESPSSFAPTPSIPLPPLRHLLHSVKEQ